MRTALEGGKLVDTGETFALPADQLFKAIGQVFLPTDVADESAVLEMDGPKIRVDAERRTSLPKVWAGGRLHRRRLGSHRRRGGGRQAGRPLHRPGARRPAWP